MTEKSLTERMEELLGGVDIMARAEQSFGLQHKAVRDALDSEIDFNRPVVFVTGRTPSQPEMQHLNGARVVHLDIETVAKIDYDELEKRVLADMGIEDVLRQAMTEKQEREFMRVLYGESAPRYRPVPPEGNRHERRARMARYRRIA